MGLTKARLLKHDLPVHGFSGSCNKCTIHALPPGTEPRGACVPSTLTPESQQWKNVGGPQILYTPTLPALKRRFKGWVCKRGTAYKKIPALGVSKYSLLPPTPQMPYGQQWGGEAYILSPWKFWLVHFRMWGGVFVTFLAAISPRKLKDEDRWEHVPSAQQRLQMKI